MISAGHHKGQMCENPKASSFLSFLRPPILNLPLLVLHWTTLLLFAWRGSSGWLVDVHRVGSFFYGRERSVRHETVLQQLFWI